MHIVFFCEGVRAHSCLKDIHFVVLYFFYLVSKNKISPLIPHVHMSLVVLRYGSMCSCQLYLLYSVRTYFIDIG
jgi:hypothetical protein